ncbi:MAG: hypothetical protein KDK71_04720 [Chlamydiia bacterium]|nr:hypothetical protein [Chlamydiia bacterium]
MKQKVFFFFLYLSVSLFGDCSYDSYGNLERIKYSENGDVCYEYDPIHRLKAAHFSMDPTFLYSKMIKENQRFERFAFKKNVALG